MYKFQFSFLLIVLYTLFPITVNAQNKDIRVKFFSIKNGLSNTNVRSIVQDKNGYIWIATLDGLDKFDGYEFIHYHYQEKDSTSLPTNDIRALLVDTKNNIWIGTGKGLSKYNFEKDNFINCILEDSTSLGMFDIMHILEDIDGSLWLSANMQGVIHYNPESRESFRLKNIPDEPASLSSNNAQSTFKDSRNNIWVTTIDEGINLYDRDTKKFRRFKNSPADPSSLAGNDVHSMIEDTDGNIWIACHYFGLSCIGLDKIKEGRFTNYYHNPNDINSPIDNSPRILCADRKGGIWIGTEDGRLDYYYKGKFSHYVMKECVTASLAENQTNCIFQDLNNDIWVGTYFGGVYLVHKTNLAFDTYNLISNKPDQYTNYKVWEFAEDSEGKIWIATDDGGLNIFDPITKKVVNYTTRNTNLNTDKVLSVFIDSHKKIWIGTWKGGLSLFNPKTKVFKSYTEENSDLSNNNVFDITEDFDGNLWLATQNGLNRFNPESELFKTYTSENSDLVFNQMETIKTDSFGNLLIGNVMGFLIFDPKTEKFTNYFNNPNDESSISNNYITSIYEESKSIIWVATRNGLNRLDRRTNEFRRYLINDGLPSNLVMGIEKDNNGNFWISSNFGLSELDIRNNIIRNFTIDDGLQDYLFIKKSHYKSKDGLIYFGGIKGFNTISTWEMTNIPEYNPLVFTEFTISNKTITPDDESKILSNPVNLTKQVILTHKHPTFSIKYSAISFLNPENTRYAYKLEGFDENWNYVGNQRQATYTNLDPGRYVLKVVNITGGVLNEKEAISLTIRILPPWWNTLLFKLLLILSIIILTIAIFRTRFASLNKQKVLLESEVQKRTLDLTDANSKLIEKQGELYQANIQLEEKQDEILAQNDELENHRNHLENLVSERTKELEMAMKKAEESDKLKSAFLANLSHEIRTPMNAIVGFSSLLDNNVVTDIERKSYIDTINNNCDTLTVLINDIIDISLIESNQVKINLSPFHADAILYELLNTYQLKNIKNLELFFDNKESTAPLILNNDPIRFKQVFSNLIGNAIKYTEKGSIKFGYKLMSDHVIFYVADTGIGINKADFDKIFDQFHKVENTDTKLYRGVGIGLSICKSLVEMMGGKIWLESKPDAGSTFYFSLPHSAKELTDHKTELIKNTMERPDLSGIRILIAENEPDNYLLLQKIIGPTHAEIIWAKNGLEAVNMIEALENFNDLIVLMDIKMPIMDGIEATLTIHSKHNEIPIIAVTAYASESDKALILKNNFSGYVTKPIRVNYLMDIIKSTLKID